MSVSESGVKLDVELEVTIMFVGKTRRYNVVSANAELDVTVRILL